MMISQWLIVILLCLSMAKVEGMSCLNGAGEPVHWWIALKVPPKIGKSGYGYYDSALKTNTFLYLDSKIDEGNTPLTKTLASINADPVEHIAWND